MFRSSPLKAGALLLPCTILLCACSQPGRNLHYADATPMDTTSNLVTFVDFFATGQDKVAKWKENLQPQEQDALERAAAACVRLELIESRQGSSYATISGSGVLVQTAGSEELHIVTAGHSLHAAQSLDARVTLRDGRMLSTATESFEFVPFGSSSDDWAILKLTDPPKDLPSLTIGTPRRGDLAYVLGYPNSMGLNDKGWVVYGKAYEESPLSPLTVVARIHGVDPLSLNPEIGSLIMGGASGGPIVNDRGELIGIATASGWSPDADSVTYWIDGASVQAFTHALSADG